MFTLREQFEAARAKSGLSQAKVAKLLGCCERTVWRFERGITKRVDEQWVADSIDAMRAEAKRRGGK